MLVKFNPTGTHIHKGFLKVRFDLFPDKSCKTYAYHYIYAPIVPKEGYKGKLDSEGNPADPKDYQAWLDSLPHVWQLNPCLCHFIVVPETVVQSSLVDYALNKVFTPNNLATLDSILIQANFADLVSPLTQSLPKLTDSKIETKDIADLIASTNQKFLGLAVELSGGGDAIKIEPQSIAIGSGATDRGVTWPATLTGVDRNNAANGSGTIDTWAFWFNTNGSGVEVATFVDAGSNTLSTRDFESIGDVAAGSPVPFSGLSTDVQTGDLAGMYSTAGDIEADQYGAGTKCYFLSGDYIPCTSQVFNVSSSRTYLSIYGTGTEAGVGDTFFENRHPIEQGMKPWTAAGMGGLLIE